MTAHRTQPTALALPLADALLRGAPALAVHWLDRLAAALPRRELPEGSVAEAPELRLERAQRVIEGVAQALAASSAAEGTAEPRPLGGGVDTLALAGWEYGVATQAVGRPLTEVAQDFQLLAAILLHECERGASGAARLAMAATEDDVVTLGEAFRVARRLQEAVALACTAALTAHAQESVSAARARLRTLRHDLRNPIATIQNVVAMMQDEGLPPEARNDPRYAAMLHRNSEALGAMVTRELGEAAAMLPTRAEGAVAVGAVALAVRRSLRAELEASGVMVEVPDELPTLRADATALALALRSALAAAVRVVPTGTVLHLGGRLLPRVDDLRAPRLRLTIGGLPAGGGDATGDDPFADARSVAERIGGRLTSEGSELVLELP